MRTFTFYISGPILAAAISPIMPVPLIACIHVCSIYNVLVHTVWMCYVAWGNVSAVTTAERERERGGGNSVYIIC